MQWLILGVGLLAGVILLMQGFVNADPKKLARNVRWIAVGLGGLVVVGLVVSGRIGMILWLLPLLLPFLARWRAMSNRAKAAAGPAPGQASGVETAHLRMWLDHDTGAMDGQVLTGRFQGRTLGDLDQYDLMDLLDELRAADPQSQALVEAFLDRSFPDWRTGAGPGQEEAGQDSGGAQDGAGGPGGRRAASSGGMTVAQALEVLGLGPDAGEEEIKDAHRRLMLRNHPDQGGSTYIAAQINQAKDLLLGRHKARS